MDRRDQTPEEIARRGREIYERDIRATVEADERLDGAFVVVDITTGNYTVGTSDDEAFEMAEEKNPDGLFYLVRIGRKTAHRIGVRSTPTYSEL